MLNIIHLPGTPSNVSPASHRMTFDSSSLSAGLRRVEGNRRGSTRQSKVRHPHNVQPKETPMHATTGEKSRVIACSTEFAELVRSRNRARPTETSDIQDHFPFGGGGVFFFSFLPFLLTFGSPSDGWPYGAYSVAIPPFVSLMTPSFLRRIATPLRSWSRGYELRRASAALIRWDPLPPSVDPRKRYGRDVV